jgi:hypothetical protein
LPDGDVRSSDIERWSLPTNFGREYREELERHPRIKLLAGYTCAAIRTEVGNEQVRDVECISIDGRTERFAARYVVLACGALETTRLLMNCAERNQLRLPSATRCLGKNYMGHISGRIAQVVFSTDSRKTIFGFHRDHEGVYVRPRFTFSTDCQLRERISNTSLWLVNPPIGDASHGNGVLSFAYLALRSPLGKYFASEAIRESAIKHGGPVRAWKHTQNILRHAAAVAGFVPSFGIKRFLCRRKVPGFFQYSNSNRYDLHFHGEQIPNPRSQVSLGKISDAVGLRRLKIDFQYSDVDVKSVIRCHELLDAYLRRHNVGRLDYIVQDRAAAIWEQAADGYHQAGTTRMASDPSNGVVDENCRVYGTENLYIASSSTFVTSSQANTTFMIGVFALRLVDHLCQKLSCSESRQTFIAGNTY